MFGYGDGVARTNNGVHYRAARTANNPKAQQFSNAGSFYGRGVEVSEYRHIELASANYVPDCIVSYCIGSRVARKFISGLTVCQKSGDYQSNRYRFSVLERTLDYLIKITGLKKMQNGCNDRQNKRYCDSTSFTRLTMYLNDSNYGELQKTRLHLLQYIMDVYSDLADVINIKILFGDMFYLDIPSIKPNSVHLKNPGGEVIYDLKEHRFRYRELLRLAKQCFSCCDDGALLLVYAEARLGRLQNVIRWHEMFGNNRDSEISIELTSKLDFDAAYNFPRKGHPLASPVWESIKRENTKVVFIRPIWNPDFSQRNPYRKK